MGTVRRAARWALALIALLALTSGVVVLNTPSAAPQPPTTADDLLALLAQGQASTYHARYVVRSEGPSGAEPQFSIETWRKPPLVRHDTVISSPSSTIHTAGYLRNGKVHRCERADQQTWDCVDSDPVEAATFDDLIGALEAELEGAAVVRERVRRQGTDLDCFTITRPSDTSTEYCVDLQGVVFSVTNGPARLERLEITRGFPNAVFTLPGESKAAKPHAPIISTVQPPPLVEDLQLIVTGPEPNDLRVPGPGAIVLPCTAGGSASHHHLVDVDLGPSAFAGIATRWRSNLDLHADGPASAAYLLPDQTNLALSNQRGALRLDLATGSCDAPTIAWDGTVASGSGTWTVDENGTGDAYRQATGAGTFVFDASFAPGNLNPYRIALDGEVSVLAPGVSAELIRSYWGHLGADYAGRVVSTHFRITAAGPGDAFHVRMLQPQAPTGFTPVEFTPTVLGDWSPGDTVEVTLRFKVGLDRPSDHKGPLVLKRQFDLTLKFEMTDALGTVRSVDVPITVTTPAFPPPL